MIQLFNMNNNLLSIKKYKFASWTKKFKNKDSDNHDVDLTKLPFHSSWNDLFLPLFEHDKFKRLQRYLSNALNKTNGTVDFFPYPELIWNAFNINLNDINVIILGQDPYFNFEKINNIYYPQAMGLAFSVPKGLSIPSSLLNIYKNLLNFNHIDSMPSHGNLSSWVSQGCLLLNTSLTVQYGHKNSHTKYWSWFTNHIIKYLSDNKEKLVFVLWGKNAIEKLPIIDIDKHKLIASSHPSGLSVNKQIGLFDAFKNVDHFGEINKYLSNHNKKTIDWNIS